MTHRTAYILVCGAALLACGDGGGAAPSSTAPTTTASAKASAAPTATVSAAVTASAPAAAAMDPFFAGLDGPAPDLKKREAVSALGVSVGLQETWKAEDYAPEPRKQLHAPDRAGVVDVMKASKEGIPAIGSKPDSDRSAFSAVKVADIEGVASHFDLQGYEGGDLYFTSSSGKTVWVNFTWKKGNDERKRQVFETLRTLKRE